VAWPNVLTENPYQKPERRPRFGPTLCDVWQGAAGLTDAEDLEVRAYRARAGSPPRAAAAAEGLGEQPGAWAWSRAVATRPRGQRPDNTTAQGPAGLPASPVGNGFARAIEAAVCPAEGGAAILHCRLRSL
jgi:hypothetical protein